MENVLFDQSPRSTLDVSLSRSSLKSMSSYSSFSSSSSSSYSPYSSASSISHLLLNYNLPPAVPKPNTKPNRNQNSIISLSHPFVSQPNQTPLLPLPSYKHSSFPYPCNNKTISNPSIPRRKPRVPKREPKPQVIQQVKTNKKITQDKTLVGAFSTSYAAAGKLTSALDDVKDEVVIVSHVKNKDKFDQYSLSPPPSSLPLPGLSLLRRKTKTNNSSNAGAIIIKEARSNNRSMDNSATNDLRRILRL